MPNRAYILLMIAVSGLPTTSAALADDPRTESILAQRGAAVIEGDGERWCGQFARLTLSSDREIVEGDEPGTLRALLGDLATTLRRECPQAAKAMIRIPTSGVMEWSFAAVKLANGSWAEQSGSWKRSQNASYAAKRADEQLKNISQSDELMEARTAPASMPAKSPPKKHHSAGNAVNQNPSPAPSKVAANKVIANRDIDKPKQPSKGAEQAPGACAKYGSVVMQEKDEYFQSQSRARGVLVNECKYAVEFEIRSQFFGRYVKVNPGYYFQPGSDEGWTGKVRKAGN